MEFEKLAELASDINLSDEKRDKMYQNCKKIYELRKKKRALPVMAMKVAKS